MKKKKEKKKILYERYLDEHKELLEEQRLKEQYQTDALIVKKVSAGAKAAQLLAEVAGRVLKLVALLILLGLLSLAVTVLVNQPLRTEVFQYLF